jgi:hypothetical protein
MEVNLMNFFAGDEGSATIGVVVFITEGLGLCRE